MSEKRYRLELFFSGIYREIELCGQEQLEVTIGTTKNCGVRLAQELFFTDFELAVQCDKESQWTLQIGDGVYLSSDSALKIRSFPLEHGQKFILHYESSGAELCHGEFLRDFEIRHQDYRRSVDLKGVSRLDIGGAAHCQVNIADSALGNDSITLQREAGGWQLIDHHSQYGVTVNGTRRTGNAMLSDYDFFSLVGHSFFLRGERLYLCSDPAMQITGVPLLEHNNSTSRMEYPRLNRSTRVYYRLPEETVEIQNPPTKQTPPEQNILVTLLPALAMLGITVLLRGVLGSGGTFVLFSVCSMSVGMGTSLYNFFQQKKKSKKGEETRVAAYTAYAQEKEAQIHQLRQREAQLLELNTPAIENTLQSLWRFDGRLYERTQNDADYLAVCVGTGVVDSTCLVKYQKQEFRNVEDPLAQWPEQLEQKYRELPQAPILLPLREVGMVGMVGNAVQSYEAVKLMTLDLCIRHSYQELRLGFLFPEEDCPRWSWARWLRHVGNDISGQRNIAYDTDNYKSLMDALYQELTEREARNDGRDKSECIPHYVIFVLEPFEILRHPISRFFGGEKNYGFTFVFCREAEELLPPCKKLVRLGNGAAQVLDAADGNKIQQYLPASVPDPQAQRAAVKLACVTVDEVDLASQLTKNMSLYRLLGIYTAQDLDLARRWQESCVYQSMAAPLGINAKNDVIALDLHEKAHGPHGLVAGTTGSGKSELLQSYILSMATLFHPYEVGFVIIDFKGGGMVNQFRALPHLVGSITDIDGREIDRSLMSIRAELNKRKTLFASANVNHIDAYIKKYRNGQVETPLPHLILIVDEFAELKTEQPEFMKELISAARIGRSLGVHLILATQKPSGVVDAQIWSNSRFKVCLKVATPEDSKEMLKTPLAAEIREPGRAYLQIGNNEMFELFQSAYSGGSSDSEISMGQRVYSIDKLLLNGSRQRIFAHKPEKAQEQRESQLQALVAMVHQHCESQGIARLSGICLPPLAAMLACPAQQRKAGKQTLEVTVGVYDAPEQQAQMPYTVSLTGNHLLVLGSALSGKTGVLQQVLRSLADSYTPVEVHVYILDFASKALGLFAGLNHVGGCVFNDQEDRIKTLFKMLGKEVRKRKECFSQLGITSYTGYKDAGKTDLPQIVVLLDNLVAFRELYPVYDDDLLYLLREGLSVGITFVVTALQSAGIGFRYLSNFSAFVVLHCNDATEYSSVLDHCRLQPKNTPGRAVVSVEKQFYEMQTYLAFEGTQEIERANNIRTYIAQMQALDGQSRAISIPEIPEHMDFAWLAQQTALTPGLPPYTVSIGMDYDTIEFVSWDLKAMSLLSVCGPEESGRTNLVRLLLESLQKKVLTTPAACFVLDHYDRKLTCVQSYGIVRQYSSDLSEGEQMLEEIQSIAAQRQEWLKQGDTEQLAKAPLVMMVVRNPDFYTTEKKCDEMFQRLLHLCRGVKILFLFSNVENTPVGYSSGNILKAIKESKAMLYTDRLENLRILDLPPALVREYKSVLKAGDAYWLRGTEVQRIKVAHVK